MSRRSHSVPDVLFVDLASMIDKRQWHVAFHYLIASLREQGYRAEVLYPRPQSIPPMRGESHIRRYLDLLKGAILKPSPNDRIFGMVLDGLVDEAVRRHPLLIGLSPYEGDRPILRAFLRKIREKGCGAKIVLGGHSATFHYDKLLRFHLEIDYVIRGEGEKAICELMQHLQGHRAISDVHGLCYRERGRVMVNEPHPLIENLDAMPPPTDDGFRELFRVQRDNPYQFTIYHPYQKKSHGNRHICVHDISVCMSRGCHRNCSFCSIQSFYHILHRPRVWRPVSPRKIVRYMTHLNRKYGVVRFDIMDDNFIGGGRKTARLKEFARLLRQEKIGIEFHVGCRSDEISGDLLRCLRPAGLRMVFLGVESFHQPALEVFNKHLTVQDNLRAIALLRKHKILLSAIVIFFHPYVTPREMLVNIEHIKKIRQHPNLGQFLPYQKLFVYKGAPIVERLRRDGLLTGSYMQNDFHFRDEASASIFALANGAVYRSQLLSTVSALTGGFGTNVLWVDNRLYRGRHALTGSINAYIQNFFYWFEFHYLVAVIEEACRWAASGFGEEFEMLEEGARQEGERIEWLYRKLMGMFIGGVERQMQKVFMAGGVRYVYLGDAMEVLRVDREMEGANGQGCGRLRERVLRRLQDGGHLLSKGEELDLQRSAYERPVLRVLEMEGRGLKRSRMELLWDWLGQRYCLGRRMEVRVAVDGEVRRVISEVGDSCSRRGYRLVIEGDVGILDKIKYVRRSVGLRVVVRDGSDVCRAVEHLQRIKSAGRTVLVVEGDQVTEAMRAAGAARGVSVVVGRCGGCHCAGEAVGVEWMGAREAMGRVVSGVESGGKRIYHCGAGREWLWVNAAGDVYACRGFERKKGMTMGNVDEGTWREAVRLLYADACVDKKKCCRRCWAKYICGGGCALRAHAVNGTVYHPDVSACAGLKASCLNYLKASVAS